MRLRKNGVGPRGGQTCIAETSLPGPGCQERGRPLKRSINGQKSNLALSWISRPVPSAIVIEPNWGVFT